MQATPAPRGRWRPADRRERLPWRREPANSDIAHIVAKTNKRRNGGHVEQLLAALTNQAQRCMDLPDRRAVLAGARCRAGLEPRWIEKSRYQMTQQIIVMLMRNCAQRGAFEASGHCAAAARAPLELVVNIEHARESSWPHHAQVVREGLNSLEDAGGKRRRPVLKAWAWSEPAPALLWRCSDFSTRMSPVKKTRSTTPEEQVA